MIATLQKSINKTLKEITKIKFLDNILVITKRSLSEREHELDQILAKSDKEGLTINIQKWEFAKNIIEWLVFKNTSQETTPLITKTEAITKLETPKTLKQIPSFMGSVRHNK